MNVICVCGYNLSSFGIFKKVINPIQIENFLSAQNQSGFEMLGNWIGG
jgi:hypothetical protein